MGDIIQKQNLGFIELIAPLGYKIRIAGDNTQSFASINIPDNALKSIDNYILVSADTPDEVDEIPEVDVGEEQISAEEALEIITGGLDNDTE